MKANIITRIADGILCLSVLLSVLCVNAASVMAGGIGAAEALEDTAAVTKAVTAPAVPYYGRDQLTSMANATALLYAYDQIVAGVEASADTISVYNGTDALTKDELSMVVDVYRRDYAHHFWLGNSYQISLISQTVLEVIPTYLLAGADLTAAKEAFEQRVTQVLSGVTGSMSEYEKELYLHDTLAGMISYVEDTHAHNAYGALVEGKAVCEGYAEALQYLLQRVGIQSFLAIGASINPGTNAAENHEWNYVRIDGKYYHTDLTWDDQDDELYHAYFNQSDAVMLEDHALSAVAFALPRCDAADAQYFSGKAAYLSTYTAKTVGRLLKDNGLSVHLYIPGSVDEFISWCYANIRDVAAEAGVTGGFSYGYSRLGREVVFEIHPSCDHVPADGTTGDCTWTLDGTQLTISGNGPMGNYDDVNTCPWGTDITSVTIEEGVTTIGDYAFYFCRSLASVTLPEGIKSIGRLSFYDCSSLLSIDIPSTVTSIGYGAFWNCSNLKNITIPVGVSVIEQNTFNGCMALKSITIPNGIESINESAFHLCRALYEVILPESIVEIGRDAFNLCSSLTLVYYSGLRGQISIVEGTSGGNAYLTNATWHYHWNNHIYDNACDNECNECYQVRYVPGHIYDDDNDANCNSCGFIREVEVPNKNGWIKEDGKWYFYENGVTVTNKWMKDRIGWVYLDGDGAMKTNTWVKDSVGWCFVGNDGYCVTNCWKADSKGWCYLDENGRMATNRWVRDSVGWCYVGADGYAVTNCWKRDSVGWCYLNSNGSMTKSAWVKDGGKWYYLDANGYMVTNAWRKDSKGWVYVGSDGAMMTNVWVRDSIGWCYVGADGYAVTNCWKKDSVGWCYLNSNGSMTKNAWIQDGGEWYYLDGNGYMVSGKTITIGGKKYTFNASGVWVSR